MTTPVTATEFFTTLDRSGLVPPDRVGPIRERAMAGDPALTSSEAVAKYFLRERLITGFQARLLLRGRYRGFFLTEKYKVLEHLGDGGMGRVLLCEHLILGRLVAVKLLHLSTATAAGAAERFLREARASAALDHPNIARVFDVDRYGTAPFMVMEYIDGTNLHQLVARHGPAAPDRAAEYARQAALGLQHAHEFGLVHRDVKPGNLIVDRAGRVRVLDLGLARYFDAGKNGELTQKFDDNSILGTADYIAPEQAIRSSAVDIRADVYSLGCSLYFLLVGKAPFDDGSVAQKLYWHQTAEPTPVRDVRPDVPENLAGVLARAMRKSPDERFGTPQEFADALAACVTGPVDPPAPDEMPKTRPAMYTLGVSPPPSRSLIGGSTAETPSLTGVDRPTGINSHLRPSGPAAWASTSRVGPLSPTSGPAQSHATGQPTYPVGVGYPSAIGPVTGVVPTGSYPQPNVSSSRAIYVAVAVLGGIMTLVGGGLMATMLGLFTPVPTAPTGVAVAPAPADPATPTPVPPRAVEYTLHGAGSSFIDDLVQVWSQEYLTRTGTRVDYESVGSGKGITFMVDEAKAFGCTDAPMKASERTAAAGHDRGEVVHVPLAFGAVVITYNLPTVQRDLRLTGGQIADIYLGRITRWNDPSIKASNPLADLPDLPIIPVHRADSSGTTDIFTDYLTRVSVAWEKGPGRAKQLAWPVDTAAGQDHGGDKNDGVAEKVNRTEGAIGYVELGYALRHSLPYALVKNRDGEWKEPTLVTVTAASMGLMQDLPDDLTFDLVDKPGKSAYPICGACWAVMYTQQDAETGRQMTDFYRWATGPEGQEFCTRLNYAPLPESLRPIISQKLGRVTGAR